MRIHILGSIAITLCMAACGEQQAPAEEPPVAAPAVETEVSAEPAPEEPTVNQALIDHMHAHAEKMDEMMYALSDGDLDGAMTPAYWLSRHESVAGVPEEWQQYLTGMREAALAVERATDLDTARAAAEKITVHCQGCHAAAGVIASE